MGDVLRKLFIVGFISQSKMIKRLATYEGADETVKDVIKALKSKEYIFWGNPIAFDCDYLFVHSQGESTVRGILKVRRVEDRQDIAEDDFSCHRPKGWGSKLEFPKYFLVEEARIVKIPIE